MAEKQVSTLVFFVNGKKVIDNSVDPEWTLLHYLRNKYLCGTKLGCAEGGCGACTVMVSKYDRESKKVNHMAVNACLAPVCSMHGLAVTTVEGIGSTHTRLHPVQERIAKAHGSQCGFCTPGIVMSMYSLLRSMEGAPSMQDLEVAFQGNLCRCTGYRAIIEGFRTFTEEWEQGQAISNGLTNGTGNGVCSMGDKCCRMQNGTKDTTEPHQKEELFKRNDFTPLSYTQEPIFPPELMLSDEYDKQYLVIQGKNNAWHRPTKLETLLELKSQHPDAKIIVGNTEVGVEVKFKHMIYPLLVQPSQIKEMCEIQVSDKGLRVGASVTLQEMENMMKAQIKMQPEHKTRIFQAIVKMLHYFAGKQIRNVAAVGGNIMTGSPISDLNPIFTAVKCELELLSKSTGPRCVKMDETFFTGYRKNVVKGDEILVAINIPYTTEDQYFIAYKQAKRRDDDIAIVNIAVNVTFKRNSFIIDDINLAFGGMAITTVLGKKARQALIGKPWTESTLETAYAALVEDLPLHPSAPGGMIMYRRSLTLSLFFKAFIAISQKLQDKFADIKVPERYKSGASTFEYIVPKSSQYFAVNPHKQQIDMVGRPMVHASAFKQATGEAVYCDDMPRIEGELYMGLVLSKEAHAKILSVDATEALNTPGVHGFFSAKDLSKKNNMVGAIEHDEEVFASQIVLNEGMLIGVVIAEDQTTAQRAARKVRVEYEKIEPVIVTIEDAIKYQSYYHGCPVVMVRGDVDKVFKEADHVIEGECRMGGQEHFYFETQCVVAVPKKEDHEVEIFCSTQNPSEITKLAAHMLGVPQNRIVTRVKRMGGGFGGKESRSILIALPAALAASRLGRPVRCMLDRDEDMMITGTRHPFLLRYRTAFNADGRILGCDISIYNNAGSSLDLSRSVLERAMFHFGNAYSIPNARVHGYVCRTNLPSNTAFRGFGGPQGMFAAENMIRDVAEFLNKY